MLEMMVINGFVFPKSDILGFGIPDVYILM